jgi:hypothetical protein
MNMIHNRSDNPSYINCNKKIQYVTVLRTPISIKIIKKLTLITIKQKLFDILLILYQPFQFLLTRKESSFQIQFESVSESGIFESFVEELVRNHIHATTFVVILMLPFTHWEKEDSNFSS